MATIKRLDPTYRMHELPQLASNCALYNDQIAYTGSKIERYVKSVGIYKHEGFIYGTGIDGKIWIIENNLDGVECVSFRDFMQGLNYYRVFPNTNVFMIGTMMNRAKQRASLPYHTRDNNCQTFVTYCLTGKCESIQVERTEIAARAFISWCELYLMSGSIDPKLIENYARIRTALKLERDEAWQKVLDQYVQHFKQASELNRKKSQRKSTAKRGATKREKEVLSLKINK